MPIKSVEREASGGTVTAELRGLSNGIHTGAGIASIDLEAQPTAFFDQYSTWRTEIAEASSERLSFDPDTLASNAHATITVEIQRKH